MMYRYRCSRKEINIENKSIRSVSVYTQRDYSRRESIGDKLNIFSSKEKK